VSENFENYNYIGKNLDLIREKINKAVLNRDNKYKNKYNGTVEKVRLLAVTKTVEAEKINFAISKGVNLIGENKVNELLEKYDKLNKNGLEIHFIGNLQTNKVKYIIDKVSLIQSVNSVRLAEEINKRAAQKNIKMDILIELNIGEEESKTGIKSEDTLEFLNALKDFKNLSVKGLMTIPPPLEKLKNIENSIKTDEKSEIKKFFDKMYQIFIDISSKKLDNIIDNINILNFSVLSMGMSEDFEEAISCGANIVRIGRAVFGERL